LGHPSINWNFPNTAIASAGSKYTGMGMEDEIPNQHIGQSVGEVCPTGTTVKALIHTQVGGNPNAVSISRIYFDRIDR
jgi:hypothetical protein